MLLSSGAGADTGSGLRIRAQERSEGWKCSLGVTAIVRAFAKDGPKSVEVRWEAVVNQNPGDQNFGETVEEEWGEGQSREARRAGRPKVKGRETSSRAACSTTEPAHRWQLGVRGDFRKSGLGGVAWKLGRRKNETGKEEKYQYRNTGMSQCGHGLYFVAGV